MPRETNSKSFLESINCPVTNCVLTHDKNFLSDPELYDAIVFHIWESWNEIKIPEKRSSKQFYVLAFLEAPPETRHNLKLDNEFFNLTMTYRLDSDILWSYGEIVDQKSGKMIAPSKSIQWREPEKVEDNELSSIVAGKTKTAAWFVSHCNSHSKRDALTRRLQKYIDVDVYGKCGPKKCSKDEKEKCDQMLNSTYKFYFSFENSLCTDYVTEKLFFAMENNIIPVVFNGADMENFVPPKSVINANDFKNVEELAKYLKYLSNDNQAYMDYFWWKKYYKVNSDIGFDGFCNLCQKVNQMSRDRKKQIYENIAQWWYGDTCKQRTIKF